MKLRVYHLEEAVIKKFGTRDGWLTVRGFVEFPAFSAKLCLFIFFHSVTLSCTCQDIIMIVCLLVPFNSVLLFFAECGTKYAGKEVGRGTI